MIETDWDRRTIELPPGWHELINELARGGQPRLRMKYIYTLAVEQLLASGAMGAIVERAWEIERECREDQDAVGKRHAKAFRAAIGRYRTHKRRQGESAGS